MAGSFAGGEPVSLARRGGARLPLPVSARRNRPDVRPAPRHRPAPAEPARRADLLLALAAAAARSEEHTSELQSLMRISYAVFFLTKKNTHYTLKYSNLYLTINNSRC